MKNKKQVNDYLISQLLSLFSYGISLGIFYFMLVQFHYETYLEREFGDLGRIFIEANSSWVDPIKIWFLEIRDAGGRYGDLKRLVWAFFSIGILSEAIKFTLKASLFNDIGFEGIVSELTGKTRMLVIAGLIVGGLFLFSLAIIGLINATS